MIRLGLVTAGGLGLLKPAPGTWGSLPPVALAAIMAALAPDDIWWAMLAVAAMASVLCVVLTPWAEAYFRRTDPGEVVIDEVAGMALALGLSPLIVAPANATDVHLAICIIAAFIWFRVFDILKPPPIAQLQRLPRGWGVLLDDLLAGIAAAALTWATFALATSMVPVDA